MILHRKMVALFALALAGLALTGCGRKAPLDTPFQAATEARKQAIENNDENVPPEPEPPVADKPFFLDPLI
ncbi:lipoprotein [Mesorhizobium sp. Z1-4]|uniref:LPS translocon maturation chaperone LptM n=1 Tax=Mesorhizobium sp. Z1-4 TaxID=2448478 RepID=UPI001980F342|nr:lipoprotein [Mesorhizobium sp. Z1-4]